MTVRFISRTLFHVFVQPFFHSLSSFNEGCICHRRRIRNTSLLKYLLTIIDAEVRELEVLSTLGSWEFETVHICLTPPDLTARTCKSTERGREAA
jgi:hypothetical protein